MNMQHWMSGRLHQLPSDVSSDVSSLMQQETWIPEFLQNDWSRIRVGLALWVIAIGIVIVVVVVLLLSREGKENRMPSGRVYARRREEDSSPKHLLEDTYYRDSQNREKR